MNDTWEFFQQAIKNPMQCASPFDSSSKTSDEILSMFNLSGSERIVELGPGTGVLTESLLEKIPRENYAGIEVNKVMVGHLKEKFPKTAFVCQPVESMPMKQWESSADLMLVSIPMLLFGEEKQTRIINFIQSTLRTRGRVIFVLAAHAHLFPKSQAFFDRLEEKLTPLESRLQIANIPPVYLKLYEKKDFHKVSRIHS